MDLGVRWLWAGVVDADAEDVSVWCIRSTLKVGSYHEIYMQVRRVLAAQRSAGMS